MQRCVREQAELQEILLQLQLPPAKIKLPFRFPAGFLTDKSLTP